MASAFAPARHSSKDKVSKDKVSTTPPPNRLLGLPLELREQIYTYVMSDSATEVLIPHDRVVPLLTYLPRRSLPAIAFTNHQLFKEVSMTYLRRTKLKVVGALYPRQSALYKFLEYLGDGNDQGFRSLRMLEYRDLYNGFALPSNLAKFKTIARESQMPNVTVLRCMGLKAVTIVIDSFKLIKPRGREALSDEVSHMKLVSPQEFDENVRLGRIFQHRGEFVLRLVFKSAVWVAKECEVRVEELVGRHVEYLEACWVEKGSKIQIVVEYD